MTNKRNDLTPGQLFACGAISASAAAWLFSSLAAGLFVLAACFFVGALATGLAE